MFSLVAKYKGRPPWKKKRFLSGIVRNPPPPLTPIRATWSFFWTSKTTFCVYDRKIFFDDDNDGCNDNYDDNFGKVDDDYDKND